MSYLRGLGFELHKFSGLRKVAFRGGLTGRRPPAGLADQMSDSDAVFVRSLLGLERLESEALKHLCILADFVFESPSLALRGLELLVSRKEVSLDHAVAYRDMLFLDSDGTQA